MSTVNERDYIVRQARDELKEEQRREAIDKMKIQLRQQKWWHRLLPFTITWRRK